MAFVDERAELIDQARDLGRVRRIAFDDQLVALGPDADVEERFELPEVVVVGPEEGRHARLGHCYLAHRRRADSRISLCNRQLTDQSQPHGRSCQRRLRVTCQGCQDAMPLNAVRRFIVAAERCPSAASASAVDSFQRRSSDRLCLSCRVTWRARLDRRCVPRTSAAVVRSGSSEQLRRVTWHLDPPFGTRTGTLGPTLLRDVGNSSR